MKNILFLLFLAALSISAQNLIPNPRCDGDFRGYFKVKGAAITSADGVVTIHGREANPALNRYQKAQCHILGAKDLAVGRTFVISFQARAKKNSGAVQVAFREARADKGSPYHGFVFKRFDIPEEWQSFTKEFTTTPGSTDLAFYIVAYYLKDADTVEFKDFSLVEKK